MNSEENIQPPVRNLQTFRVEESIWFGVNAQEIDIIVSNDTLVSS
jgi:hypothetical protein